MNKTVVVANSLNEWMFMVPSYLFIFCMALSGNCLVIATLANKRRMRTVTNIFLLNLAVADFLLATLCMPFTLIGQIYRRFLFGATLCKIIPFLQAVSVSVSIWTLVAISLERYFAICQPLKSRKWQTKCHAYKMIAILWTMSFVFDSPILVVSTLLPMRDNAFKCREFWQNPQMEIAFNISLDLVMLIVPLFIMVFVYFLIVCKLWRGMRYETQHNATWQNNVKQITQKANSSLETSVVKGSSGQLPNSEENTLKEPQEPEGKSDLEKIETFFKHDLESDFCHVVRSTHIEKSIQNKRKVIKMLFVVIAEFFICWTPLYVLNTIYLFYPKQLSQYIGSKGVLSLQLLAYCSTCCNPITYCFMNHNFQQAFLELFQNCWFCIKKDNVRAKTPTPPPPPSSSPEMAACIINGSHTGRAELERAVVEVAEDCV